MRQLTARWLQSVTTAIPGGDFAVSPAGLWLALRALAAGARGTTAAALGDLLESTGNEVPHRLAGTDALVAATSIRTRSPLYEAYRASLPDIEFADLGTTTQATLDAWVRRTTDGLVERLPLTVTPGTRLLVVNALALRSRWADPFDPSETHDRPFTDAAGAVHRVPTMSKTLPAHAAWAVPEPSGGRTRVVELHCATEGFAPAVVRFVIGSPGRAAADVLPAAWAPPSLRAPLDADRVRVLLPRLTLRTTLDATAHFPALGLGVCTSDSADFSGMSPDPLKVDGLVQEAVVKVAEEGIEAAAATALRMMFAGMLTSRPRIEEIAFDRPFGLVVLDSAGELPLFAAWQASAPHFDAV